MAEARFLVITTTPLILEVKIKDYIDTEEMANIHARQSVENIIAEYGEGAQYQVLVVETKNTWSDDG